MPRPRVLLALVALVAVILVACQPAADGGAALTGRLWQWTETTLSEPATIADPTRYTITFAEDGTYSAKVDCNQASGAFTTTAEGGITIGSGAGFGLLGGAALGGLATAALPGMLAAGAAGAMLGALIDLGIPEDSASFYQKEWESGRALVTVRAPGRETEAADLLRTQGAQEVRP